jgi:AcrR family transcriptional regulator
MDTREHIIKTSFALFASRSYKDVTMSEIVQRAGLSKGAVYHYFASKEDLFRAIVEDYFLSGFSSQLIKLDKKSLRGFFNGFIEVSSAFVKRITEDLKFKDFESVVNIYMLLFEGLRHLPGLKDLVVRALTIERSVWIEVIRNARDSGEISTCMPDEQLARIFVAISDGIAMQKLMDGDLDQVYSSILEHWKSLYSEIKTK